MCIAEEGAYKAPPGITAHFLLPFTLRARAVESRNVEADLVEFCRNLTVFTKMPALAAWFSPSL